jgi:hypothetical protein
MKLRRYDCYDRGGQNWRIEIEARSLRGCLGGRCISQMAIGLNPTRGHRAVAAGEGFERERLTASPSQVTRAYKLAAVCTD